MESYAYSNSAEKFMKVKDSFHPYAMITIAGWSMAYVFTRLALHHFSVYSLGFLRYLVASASLLAVAVLMRLRPPVFRDIRWFFLSGAAGFFLYMITFNKGTSLVAAATGSVIISTVPIMTSVLARFIYNERLEVYQWIAAGIEFTGIIILTCTGKDISAGAGVPWLIAAAVLLSSYNIIQQKLTRKYTSLQVSSYSIFAGTLMLSIFAPGSVAEVRAAPPIQFFYLAILGIFSSAIAYVSWTKAFSKAEKTAHVSNYMFITPFLTGVLGYLIAGEVPGMSTFTGGAVIMAGFVLFYKDNFLPGGYTADDVSHGYAGDKES